MPAPPLVSIIMPAHNAERFIEDACDSVLAQTYMNWELLIVNDASQDSTLEISLSIARLDSRIKVFNLQMNAGVAAARNLALSRAKGEYVAFLDSDDLWLPDKLQKQISFMETEKILISYTWYQRINEYGEEVSNVYAPHEVTYSDMLKSNFIGNLTGVYNAEVLGKEFFTEFNHEDYVAWLSLMKKAEHARAVPEILAQYRVCSGSISANKIKALGWQWRIYRFSQSLGFFHSCGLMCHYCLHAIYKRNSITPF